MVTKINAQAAAQQVAAQALVGAKLGAKAVRKRVVQPAQKAVMGTLGLSGERMTRVDTAWLRMDSPSNLMMIVGVWVLKPHVGYDDLCDRVEERLLAYRRFKQKVVVDPAGATWVNDPEFSMAHHVQTAHLHRGPDETDDSASLKRMVGGLSMEPLDPKRPLWQFHLVEDYVGPDGEKASALVARIHHCIADGIALIAVMMSLVDGGSAPPTKTGKKPEGVEDWINATLLKPFASVANKALDMAQQGATRGFSTAADMGMRAQSLGAAGLEQTMTMLLNPQQGVQDLMQAFGNSFNTSGFYGLQNTLAENAPQAMEAARMAMQIGSDLTALAVMPMDSETRLKAQPDNIKRVAWCDPVPLEDVRAVSKALGCSINDVLLGCVAGAIGQYLREKGDDPSGQEIRVMVPVNLRPLEQAYKLGNRFGLVPLLLPIGIDNPVERVFEVRKRMSALKGSYTPLLAFSLLAMAGLLVKPAQDALLHMFAKKATAVMTNVPGPKEKLKFCGATLDQTMFWVPQSGGIGMGVSILSYGGGVQFGVITDTGMCPDPQAIIDEFEPEFIKLMWTVLMLPWDGEPV
jgi:diacylglycerol O-acyltransferase / wax synthase